MSSGRVKVTAQPIPTSGHVVGEKVVLEVVRDAQDPTRLALLRCDNGSWRVAVQQKLGGKIYVPPNIDGKIVECLRLPVRAASYGSTRKTFLRDQGHVRNFRRPERGTSGACHIHWFCYSLRRLCTGGSVPDAHRLGDLSVPRRS